MHIKADQYESDSLQLGISAVVEAAALDVHLEFAANLLEHHSWEKSVRNQIEQALDKINNRRQDSCLYLGVIGEFSSGKTTAINAFIRDDLLRTNVLQATTSAATIIRYSDELDVELKFCNGDIKTYQQDGVTLWHRFSKLFKKPTHEIQKGRLRSFVHAVTAEEEIAKTIEVVTIEHPSEALRNGLVIVDTPGTNADNQRHADVAIWALQERCDAAIVVIPADVPLSATLLRFVKEHLSEVAHRCIFFVTKMDLVRRQSERARLLANIQNRLKQELELTSVHILAASPRSVIDIITEDEEADIDVARLHMHEFEQVQNELIRILELNRDLMQVERLSILLSRLFVWLPDELKRYEQVYRDKHDAVLRSVPPDLGKFVRERKAYHQAEFSQSSTAQIDVLRGVVDGLRKKTENSVKQLIGNCDSNGALGKAAKHINKEYANKITDEVNSSLRPIFSDINKCTNQQINKFEEEFKKAYQSLAILKDDGVAADLNNDIQRDLKMENAVEARTADIMKLVSEAEDNEAYASIGGAGAGAVIGTFIAPGIGTVIGGAIGLIAGLFFGPPLDEIKKECLEKLLKGINEAFDQVDSSTRDSCRGLIDNEKKRLGHVMDKYFDHYGRLVRDIIEKDSAEAAELERRTQLAVDDAKLIAEHQVQLDSWRERISGVQFSAPIDGVRQ